MRFSCFLYVLCFGFYLMLLLLCAPSASTRLFLISQTKNGAPVISATVTQKDELHDTQFSIKEEKKMGSRPPRCEHKCYRCEPCEPVQVPTNANSGLNLDLEYTNYEPEGWKCKCGPTFYTP